MSKLYLVRHGQASAGTHDYDRLSDLGREQSRLLGQWWKEHAFRPDTVYHGSLLRQRDTALEATGSLGIELPFQVHEGLNEYDHRNVESRYAHESANETPESMTFEEYLAIMQRWQNQQPVKPEQSPAEDFETWDTFIARGWNTMQSIHETGKSGHSAVYFTSGGVIASVLACVLNLDFHHTIDAIWRIRNTSVTTLDYDGVNARLVEFNTVAHLQTKANRSLITLI